VLLPGTRKIQPSRDAIIDVFDFSSAGTFLALQSNYSSASE
jgi:hypothetical protein